MQLQSGTFLQGGKYRIESILGQGGFGITYLGWQTGLNRRVAIKEFFMKEYCNRNTDTSHVTIGTEGSRELVDRFRQKFIKEAQTIATLDHPNVVRIHDVFEENGTAYYVMEYVEGESLQKYVAANGALQEQEALFYIRKAAAALEYIHGHQMNHLDVKPDNILRRNDAQIVLIDFGLSKRYDESGHQTSSTPVGISTGYAPMEQYKRGGVGTFSPETDIYALGATLYKLLTGKTPPDANDVFDNGLPKLPAGISEATTRALLAAMQPKRSERPQSIQAFLNILNSQEKNEKAEDTIIPDHRKKKPETEKRLIEKKPYFQEFRGAGIAVAVCLVVALGIWWFTGKRSTPEPVLVDNMAIVDSIAWAEAEAAAADTVAVDSEYIIATVAEPIPPKIAESKPRNNSNEPTSGNPVDLGLSVKWAAYNVGASSPEGYGGLYGWADPTGEKRSTNDNDYPSADPPSNISGTQYDIARAKWGGKWRLPKQREFQELSDKCTWKWEEFKGVAGYMVTGPNGNRIFLPASGWRNGESVYNRGSDGEYWSGTFRSDSFAYNLYVRSHSWSPLSYVGRCIGQSVRPVSD